MIKFEIIETTKNATGFKFEVQVEGYIKSVWITLPSVMYDSMTPEQIAEHITSVIESRYADVIISQPENVKLDSVLNIINKGNT